MQTKSRVRHHKIFTEKADILAACERSGMTQRELVAQHGMLHRGIPNQTGRVFINSLTHWQTANLAWL